VEQLQTWTSRMLADGDDAARRGDFETARSFYARAVPAEGSHERLCHATASLNDRSQEALACTRSALALLPTNEFLLALDGQESVAAGDFARAAASFARAERLNPESFDLRLNLGIALLGAGRASEAVHPLQAATALSPSDPAAYTQLARALEHNAVSSADARAHAARLAPTAAAHVEAGNALLADGRPSEAVAAMKQALRLDRKASAAYFGLGQASMALHAPCTARIALRRAAKLAPHDADVLHRSGVASLYCSRAEAAASAASAASAETSSSSSSATTTTATTEAAAASAATALRFEAAAAWRRAIGLYPRSDALTLLDAHEQWEAAAATAAAATAAAATAAAATAATGAAAEVAVLKTAPPPMGERQTVLKTAHASSLRVAVDDRGGSGSSVGDTKDEDGEDEDGKDIDAHDDTGSSIKRVPTSAIALTVNATSEATGRRWLARALAVYRRYGAVIIRDVLPAHLADDLASHLRTLLSSQGAKRLEVKPSQAKSSQAKRVEGRVVDRGSAHAGASGTEGLTDSVILEPSSDARRGGAGSTGATGAAYETTNSTFAPHRRRHLAVSLQAPSVLAALRAVGQVLHPLVCAALLGTSSGECGDVALRLVESGMLVSAPGAVAQPIHSDTNGAHWPLEARALKCQVGAMEVTAPMGPLEIFPGTFAHSANANAAFMAVSLAAGAQRPSTLKPVALPLLKGAVLLYDTTLWHRGGAHRAHKAKRRRMQYYVTLLGERGEPPAGLPFTIEPEEVARFRLTQNGVTRV
jgi:tetratricopeptide (TPR) repeat protein